MTPRFWLLDFEGKDKEDLVLQNARVTEALLSIDDELHLKVSSDLTEVLKSQGAKIDLTRGHANKSLEINFSGMQSETLNSGYLFREGKFQRIHRKYVMRFRDPRGTKSSAQNKRLRIVN